MTTIFLPFPWHRILKTLLWDFNGIYTPCTTGWYHRKNILQNIGESNKQNKTGQETWHSMEEISAAGSCSQTWVEVLLQASTLKKTCRHSLESPPWGHGSELLCVHYKPASRGQVSLLWPKQLFILGFKYTCKNKCQLLNFVLGQAKMAVYFSWRRKVLLDGFIVESVTVCIHMMKSRLLIDFNNYKAAGDLDSFQQVWCFNQALCSVENHTLQFGDVFMWIKYLFIYLFIHFCLITACSRLL